MRHDLHGAPDRLELELGIRPDPRHREEWSMSGTRSGESLQRHAPPRRRRRRRRRREPEPSAPSAEQRPAEADSSSAVLEEMDESLMSPEERAYLRGRRLAEAKMDLYRRAVRAGLILIPLMIFIPWVAFIVLCISVLDLGKRYYRLVVEPGLRERLIEEEVGKQVQASVGREREALKDEHQRSMEELSASIAHEIRNPITAAKSLVQQMGEDPQADDNAEYAQVALNELERVERSITHLLRYARDEDFRRADVQLVDVLESAIETFRDRAAREDVEIVRQFDSEGSIQGDAEKLRRVFINLVGNAIDSLVEADVEKKNVEVALGENLAGTEVWVRVRDNGPGIDPETERKIFDPFFTSKSGGTGLGLPITRKIVEAHEGTIEVDSIPGDGASFILTFPRSNGEPR